MNRIIEYLKAIENPQRVGFNSKTRIWEQPTQGGFDRNQIGYGLDVKWGPLAKFLAERKRKTGRVYLTEDEETYFREKYIRGYLTDTFNRNTAHYSNPTGGGFGVMSERKKAIAYGLLYRGDGKKLWNSGNAIYQSFWNGTDADFEKAVIDYYSDILPERVRCHKLYWGEIPSSQVQMVDYSPSQSTSNYKILPPENFRRGGILGDKKEVKRKKLIPRRLIK